MGYGGVNMVKTIVFDLGNVLLSFDPVKYIENKINDESKVSTVCEAIFKSEEWLMLDRGTITEREAIDRIVERNLELSELIELVMDNWYEILTPMEESFKILGELKEKGYKILFLSNFHMIAAEKVVARYEFNKHFHGGVFSYVENLLKPEKEIYLRLLEKYDLVPEETIFIDDTKVNVEAANSLGINGLVFENADKLREDLNKLI